MKSCDEAATQRDRERRLRGSAACDEKDEDTATGEMASWPLPSCWARLVWGSAEADGLLASFFPVFWSVRLAYLLTRVWQGYFVPLCVDFCRPLHLRQQLVLFFGGVACSFKWMGTAMGRGLWGRPRPTSSRLPTQFIFPASRCPSPSNVFSIELVNKLASRYMKPLFLPAPTKTKGGRTFEPRHP